MEETERMECTAPETTGAGAEQVREELQARDVPGGENENVRTEPEEIAFPPQLPEDDTPWQDESPREEEMPRLNEGPRQSETGRQEQDLRREPEREKPGWPQSAGRGRAPQPDFRGQVRRLLDRYPHVRALPEEVIHACARDGRELLEVYEAHQTRQAQQAENQRLRRELATLRRNEDTRRRAPVTGVGPGGVPNHGEDDFLRGFNSDY